MPEFIDDVVSKIYIWGQIIIGLGLLIFIHEAGHFLVAKWKGVRVDAFSLGMGPILWKRLWRGTEYRISAIPLGGYVKMAGENIGDPKTGAPDELTSKSAFARLQIFAAGALMNLVIAFPIAILACLAGRTEGSPFVGTRLSEADRTAGILPGDRILEVEGRKIASTDDYRKQMVRLSQGSKADVLVERDGKPMTFQVPVLASHRHLTFPPITTFLDIKPGSPAHQAGLRSHDEILEIDGENAFRLDDAGLLKKIAESSTRTVKLKVRNPEHGERTIDLKDMPSKTDVWIPRSWELLEPVIGAPKEKTPAAAAGLREGDRLRSIAGKEIRNFQDIVKAMEGRGGEEVEIEFERGGTPQKVKLRAEYGSGTQGVLGVRPGHSSRVVDVPPGSLYEKAGLQSGDEIVTISTLPNAAVADIAMDGRPGPVTLQVRRGGELKDITIEGEERTQFDPKAAGFLTRDTGEIWLDPNRIQRRWGFKDAVVTGLSEPVEMIELTVKILGKLFVREEEATGLAGPIGIFKASFHHAETGIGNFLWLLVLITVNLGIFNLLPVPVLDGGHILLLAIEKVKGSPPSPRFVERFQLVGLVLLLSLLIFVTVNDLR